MPNELRGGNPYLVTSAEDRVDLIAECTIGRSPQATLTVADTKVSRMHARIAHRTGAWWLSDLGSKNGTFVNGSSIGPTATCLTDGDEVVIGGAIALVFHDPAATPIAPRIGRLVGVWIDPDTDAVWVDAVRIEPPLSAKQLALLKLLDDNRGEIVTRAAIVSQIWADAAAAGVSDDAVTALIKRLRARLREAPRKIDFVEIVKGRGIRLPE